MAKRETADATVLRRQVEIAIMEAVDEERGRIIAWLQDRAKHVRSVKGQQALENAAQDLSRYSPGWRE